MYTYLLLMSFLVCVLGDNTFDGYLKYFKIIINQEDYIYRNNIFTNELKRVLEHNKKI